MLLKTVPRATKIAISAIIFVEKVSLIVLILFSLRQYYLDQVFRVDDSIVVLSAELTQLPIHLTEKEIILDI